MLIKEKKYKPGMSRKVDPFFYGYKYMDGYIYRKTLAAVEYDMGQTLDTLSKCYDYGVIQCFLLDRLFPGWKTGFFQGGATLDEVTREVPQDVGRGTQGDRRRVQGQIQI